MSLYIGDEIPRAKEENPEGLTVLELEERKRAVNEILRTQPNADPKHVEWAWNYIRRKGLQTVREQINTGFFDKPSEFSVPPGGVLKTAWVYEPDGSLASPPLNNELLPAI